MNHQQRHNEFRRGQEEFLWGNPVCA